VNRHDLCRLLHPHAMPARGRCFPEGSLAQAARASVEFLRLAAERGEILSTGANRLARSLRRPIAGGRQRGRCSAVCRTPTPCARRWNARARRPALRRR
jgi:hypothetical protein